MPCINCYRFLSVVAHFYMTLAKMEKSDQNSILSPVGKTRQTNRRFPWKNEESVYD